MTNKVTLTLSMPILVNPACSCLKLFMNSCSNLVLNLTFFKTTDPVRQLGEKTKQMWRDELNALEAQL